MDDYDYLEQQVDKGGEAAALPPLDEIPVLRVVPLELLTGSHHGHRSSRDKERRRSRSRDKERSSSRRHKERSRSRSRHERERSGRERDRERERERGSRHEPRDRYHAADHAPRCGWGGPHGRRGGGCMGELLPTPTPRHATPCTPRRRPEREKTPPEVQMARQKEQELKELERTVRTIMVMNLNLKAEEEQVFDFFSRVGEINDIKIIRDKNNKRSKGIAYVEFTSVEAAIGALSLNGQPMMNMPVLVKPSEAEKVRGAGGMGAGGGRMRLGRERACSRVRLPPDPTLPALARPRRTCNGRRSSRPSRTRARRRSCSTRWAAGSPSPSSCRCDGAAAVAAPAAARRLLCRAMCVPVHWPAHRPAPPRARNAARIACALCTPTQILNLHPEVSEEDLMGLFTPFGNVTYCHVVREPNGSSTGEAFVQYSDKPMVRREGVVQRVVRGAGQHSCRGPTGQPRGSLTRRARVDALRRRRRPRRTSTTLRLPGGK